MAKGKKSKSSGAISNGGRQKAKVHQNEKRMSKFAKKREEGKQYVYHKNSYDPKTQAEQWAQEEYDRKQKAKSSKLPYARLTSIFAKLQNEVDKEKLRAKSENNSTKRRGKNNE